eukprot:gb/GECG01010221.1/.p1 GENE.gb/GECG01010221.1/~~gb/GECG01010221.1/.p1  ORF type:complete len:793 (+),score=77.27 gb/GECG01010221.1/:1-2379(+)
MADEQEETLRGIRLAPVISASVSQESNTVLRRWVERYILPGDDGENMDLPYVVLVQSNHQHQPRKKPGMALMHSRKTDYCCLVQLITVGFTEDCHANPSRSTQGLGAAAAATIQFGSEEDSDRNSLDQPVALIGMRVADLLGLRDTVRNSDVHPWNAFASKLETDANTQNRRRDGGLLVFDGGLGTLRCSETLVQVATGNVSSENGISSPKHPDAGTGNVLQADYVTVALLTSTRKTNFGSTEDAEQVLKSYFERTSRVVHSGELVVIRCADYESVGSSVPQTAVENMKSGGESKSLPLYSSFEGPCRGILVFKILEMYTEKLSPSSKSLPILAGSVSEASRMVLNPDLSDFLSLVGCPLAQNDFIEGLDSIKRCDERSMGLSLLRLFLSSASFERLLCVVGKDISLGDSDHERISCSTFYSVVRRLFHKEANFSYDQSCWSYDTTPVVFAETDSLIVAADAVLKCGQELGTAVVKVNIGDVLVQTMNTRGGSPVAVFCKILESLVSSIAHNFEPTIVHIPDIDLISVLVHQQNDKEHAQQENTAGADIWSPFITMIEKWTFEYSDTSYNVKQSEQRGNVYSSKTPRSLTELQNCEFKPLEEWSEGNDCLNGVAHHPRGRPAQQRAHTDRPIAIIFSTTDASKLPEPVVSSFLERLELTMDIGATVDNLVDYQDIIPIGYPHLCKSSQPEKRLRFAFLCYGAIPDDALFLERPLLRKVATLNLESLVRFIEDCIRIQTTEAQSSDRLHISLDTLNSALKFIPVSGFCTGLLHIARAMSCLYRMMACARKRRR